jgi:hypothetical protein
VLFSPPGSRASAENRLTIVLQMCSTIVADLFVAFTIFWYFSFESTKKEKEYQ